ncbi:MAG: PadR family transcriptional regulator [Vicinamibacterales bacterium]
MKGDHVGEFEELVLLAIHGLSRDAYGVAIQQLLQRETTRSVSLGAVYACLDRLEAKGLVTSQMTDGTSARGGRSRRMFRLSPEGARTLASLRELRARLYGAARPRTFRGRA